jgi:hypothetical protein
VKKSLANAIGYITLGYEMKKVLLLLTIWLMPLSVLHAQQADTPTYKVGDAWIWITTDTLTKIETGKTTLRVDSIDENINLISGAGQSPTIKWALDGRYLSNQKSGRSMKYLNPSEFPLTLGKKWIIEVEWTNPDGRKGKTKQDAVVSAIEEITTKAGNFTAYKIERFGFYENFTANSRGKQVETIWYSPDAGVAVKSTFNDGYTNSTTELTGYKRN